MDQGEATGSRSAEIVTPAPHTPTPWECTGGDIWIDTREQVCCGRGYSECCGEPDVRGGQELIAQSNPIDAAFIVRAVNSHDALVKALEDLLEAHGGLGVSPAVARARAALAAARGE